MSIYKITLKIIATGSVWLICKVFYTNSR